MSVNSGRGFPNSESSASLGCAEADVFRDVTVITEGYFVRSEFL
jgi:hypothetical protein